MNIQDKREIIRAKLLYISRAIDDKKSEEDFIKRLDIKYIDRYINSIYEYIQNEHVIHLKE